MHESKASISNSFHPLCDTVIGVRRNDVTAQNDEIEDFGFSQEKKPKTVFCYNCGQPGKEEGSGLSC